MSITGELRNFPGSSPAFVFEDHIYTYDDLLQRIAFYVENLRKIREGSVVALLGSYQFESLSLFLACLERNMIVAPLESIDDKKVSMCEADYVLSCSDGFSCHEVERKTEHHELILEVQNKGHGGLIYFTSGTGGDEKVVLHDYQEFNQKLIRPKKSLRSIVFLKFNHFGGFNTLMPILFSGGTAIFPCQKDPQSIFLLIEKYKVELLPVTPSFLSMALAVKAWEGIDLSSLKILSYGAEPMPQYLLERWLSILPDVKFHQTYGMTETGTLKTSSESSKSLFFKILEAGSLTRVVNGLLELKLPYLMKGYLNAPSPVTPDGWFRTGDLAEEKDGYIHVRGRQNEAIIVSGEKVSPHEVEAVLNNIEGVMNAKVYGKDHLLTGQIVVAEIFVPPELRNDQFINKIKIECSKKLEFYKVPVEVDFYDPLRNNEVKRIRKKSTG